MKRLWLPILVLAILAGPRDQDPIEIPLGIDEADRAGIRIAVQEVFPDAKEFTLRPQRRGWSSADRILNVDLPATSSRGRLARHPSLRCERDRDTGDWSCGDERRILWEVRPTADWKRGCGGSARGIDAITIATDDEIVEVVDFFRSSEELGAAMEQTESCRTYRLDPCRMTAITDASKSAIPVRGDYLVGFLASANESLLVHVNRRCPWIGACSLEVGGCSLLMSD